MGSGSSKAKGETAVVSAPSTIAASGTAATSPSPEVSLSVVPLKPTFTYLSRNSDTSVSALFQWSAVYYFRVKLTLRRAVRYAWSQQRRGARSSSAPSGR
jgi:hypothetical protein